MCYDIFQIIELPSVKRLIKCEHAFWIFRDVLRTHTSIYIYVLKHVFEHDLKKILYSFV